MGFFGAILEAIAKNYIFFQAVTIFLVLSFIGYFVDKKTRKGADVTPIFGGKISLNIKHRDPSTKKGKKKKGFSSTIVGGQTAMPGINNVMGQSTSTDTNQFAQSNHTYYDNQTYNQNAFATNNAGQYQQYPSYDTTTIVSQQNYDFNNIEQKPTNELVEPAATTAQISESILPNVATAPVQAQVQGVSTAAPAMETIVPGVQSEISTTPVQNEFASNNGAIDESDSDDGAMNFNMNE